MGVEAKSDFVMLDMLLLLIFNAPLPVGGTFMERIWGNT